MMPEKFHYLCAECNHKFFALDWSDPTCPVGKCPECGSVAVLHQLTDRMLQIKMLQDKIAVYEKAITNHDENDACPECYALRDEILAGLAEVEKKYE
jgi:DNA-directed RNA polymerase subunit RPC12/RpoP